MASPASIHPNEDASTEKDTKDRQIQCRVPPEVLTLILEIYIGMRDKELEQRRIFVAEEYDRKLAAQNASPDIMGWRYNPEWRQQLVPS